MAKYLFHGSYTVEGLKGLIKEGGTGRREATENLANSLGGKVEAYYFAFGGNDFYHQFAFSERLSRTARTAFTLFWGQYGLPLPFPAKCSMVLADPIVACDEPIRNPSNEQVEELLVRYIDALRRLFDQYKAQAGYPNAQLEIR